MVIVTVLAGEGRCKLAHFNCIVRFKEVKVGKLVLARIASGKKYNSSPFIFQSRRAPASRAQITMKSITGVRIKQTCQSSLTRVPQKRSSALPSAPDTFATPSHSAIVGRTRVISHTPLSPQWGAPKNECATKRAGKSGYSERL